MLEPDSCLTPSDDIEFGVVGMSSDVLETLDDVEDLDSGYTYC